MSVVSHRSSNSLTLRPSAILRTLLGLSMFAMLVSGLSPIIPLSEPLGQARADKREPFAHFQSWLLDKVPAEYRKQRDRN